MEHKYIMGCLMKLNDPQHRGMMMIISSIYTGGMGEERGMRFKGTKESEVKWR